MFGNGDQILADNYRYRDASVEWQTNQERILSFQTRSGGQFYDGNRLSYRANLSYRGGGRIGRSELDGQIRFDEREDDSPMLIGSNIAVSFSQKIQCNTFVQYNTQLDNFNVNTRFQWRYAPMVVFSFTDNYFDDFALKSCPCFTSKLLVVGFLEKMLSLSGRFRANPHVFGEYRLFIQ